MNLDQAISTKETDIISMLKAGNEQSISILFDMHYDYLCKCVYAMLKDAQGSEDVVQEVFTDFWNKRDSININTSIKGYLRRASINKTLNVIRKKKYLIDEANEAVQITANISSSQEVMEGNEIKLRVERIIAALPEKCRTAFKLSRFEELSYREIAEKMDLSIKTVENHISRALKILRLELQYQAA